MKHTLSLLIRCTLVLGACSALLVGCKKAPEKSRGGSEDKPEASETQQGVQDPKPNVPDPAELPNVPDPAKQLEDPTDPTEEDG